MCAIFFSQAKHVVETQKNCLNEMVPLSTQNIIMLTLMDQKIHIFTRPFQDKKIAAQS